MIGQGGFVYGFYIYTYIYGGTIFKLEALTIKYEICVVGRTGFQVSLCDDTKYKVLLIINLGQLDNDEMINHHPNIAVCHNISIYYT